MKPCLGWAKIDYTTLAAKLTAVKVTAFSDPSTLAEDGRGEITRGKLLIDVAKEVGVKFFVWRSVCVFFLLHAICSFPLKLLAEWHRVIEGQVYCTAAV